MLQVTARSYNKKAKNRRTFAVTTSPILLERLFNKFACGNLSGQPEGRSALVSIELAWSTAIISVHAKGVR